jgi:Ca-activated chloride channel homolog
MSGGSLRIFVRPERRFVPEGTPSEMLVLVRLLAAVRNPGEQRVPMNLGVVIDRVGFGDRAAWGEVVAAIGAVVEQLSGDDRLSLVVVDDGVELLLSAKGGQEAARVVRLLRAMEPYEPDTAKPKGDRRELLYTGWLVASNEVALHHDRAQLNRVWVVSSASADPPNDGRSELVDASRGLFRLGVSTSTFGVGEGFDEDILLPLAVEGGGTPNLVLERAGLGPRLLAELDAARSIFCEWSTLRLDVEGADVLEVLNELPVLADRKVSLPSLYGGVPLNVVLRLRLDASSQSGEIHPLTVRIKSLDLQARQAVVHKKALRLHVASRALSDSMGADLGVQAHGARLEFARMHLKCTRRIDAGDLPGAQQLVDFALARFGSLSGQAGGTMLTEDMFAMMRLRDGLTVPERRARNRKQLLYAAAYAQRGGYASPFDE